MSKVDDVIREINAAMDVVNKRRVEAEKKQETKPRPPVIMDAEKIEQIRRWRYVNQYQMWF